jgi:hypothetical protein
MASEDCTELAGNLLDDRAPDQAAQDLGAPVVGRPPEQRRPLAIVRCKSASRAHEASGTGWLPMPSR